VVKATLYGVPTNPTGKLVGETVITAGATQLDVSATTVANGVSTTPVNAILSTFHPAAPAALSVPIRKRTLTAEPGAIARVSDV
jgi:hypothetical protein